MQSLVGFIFGTGGGGFLARRVTIALNEIATKGSKFLKKALHRNNLDARRAAR